MKRFWNSDEPKPDSVKAAGPDEPTPAPPQPVAGKTAVTHQPPPIANETGITVGIELEFLVPYHFVIPDEQTPLDKEIIAKGKAVDFNEMEHWPENLNQEDIVQLEIGKVLKKHGFPVLDGDENVKYCKWQVSYDSTINNLLPKEESKALDWHGIELISPILDADTAETTIQNVMNCIKGAFHVHINPSCGLHVHLGVGAGERIPTDVLRRFGALIWAAEPLMASLHPPERALNEQTRSIRLESRLARGYTKENVIPDGKVHPITPPGRLESRWQRVLDQNVEESYGVPWDDRQAIARHELYVHQEGDKLRERPEPIMKGIFPAALHLLQCDTSRQVAWLLACVSDDPNPFKPSLRGNFAFNNYLAPHNECPTVEVRLAAGSFDPDWVAAWTTICTKLFQFAKDKSDKYTLCLLEHMNDKNPTIIDLLRNKWIGCPKSYVHAAWDRHFRAKTTGWYESDIYNKDLPVKEEKKEAEFNQVKGETDDGRGMGPSALASSASHCAQQAWQQHRETEGAVVASPSAHILPFRERESPLHSPSRPAHISDAKDTPGSGPRATPGAVVESAQSDIPGDSRRTVQIPRLPVKPRGPFGRS